MFFFFIVITARRWKIVTPRKRKKRRDNRSMKLYYYNSAYRTIEKMYCNILQAINTHDKNPACLKIGLSHGIFLEKINLD